MYISRALALCAVLGISVLAAGCGGHSEATPPMLPAASAVPNTGSGTIHPMSTTTPTVGLVGQVTYVTSGKFEVQGGSHIGYLYIYTNSGTSWNYNGLTLKPGVYATIYGTGSLSSSVTATSVSLSTSGTDGAISASSAPTTTTTSTTSTATTSTATTTPTVGLVGQVTYITSGKFEVQGGSHIGYLYIYTNSGTSWSYNGLTLKVGDYATIYGTGSLNTSVTATSVSLSTSGTEGPLSVSGGTTTPTTSSTPPPVTTSTNVPRHVQTAEYLTGSTESSTNPSVYAPYLTWAYTLTGNLGKTQAAGIKTVIYTDPVMPTRGQYEYNELTSTYSSARATGCNGSYSTNYNGTGYVLDPTKSSAASYVTNVINYYVNKAIASNPGYSHPYNLIFVDNSGEPYGATPMPCDFTDSGYGSALDADLAPSGQPVLLNTLSTSSSLISTYVQRLKGSNVQGGEYEHCFDDRQWAPEENAQLQAIALVKSEGKAPGPGFWCYVDGSQGSMTGSLAIPSRMYYYASFLLTYDPNYSVYQVAFSTPSTFKVFPETGFVPMNPASTPASISSLMTSTGAYVQRYSACYYRASLIGQCEIAVNPGSTTVSVPNPAGLAHSAVLSGGGVLDGGTMTFGGGHVTSLAPASAAILVP